MNSDVLFFVSVAAGLAGQFLDCYTTDMGLAHGWKESSGPAAWLISKVGSGPLYALKCAGFGIVAPIVLVIIGKHTGVGDIAGIAVAVVAAGAGFYAGIKNYLRLKAAKISIF
jgi:hypothetical protein